MASSDNGNWVCGDRVDSGHEYELFRKQLTESDIKSGLAVPAGVASTNCMPSLLDEEKMLLKVMGREEGRSWAFVYSKSKGRSTLTGEAWRFFVTSKQLSAGDVVKFSWSVLYYLIDIVKKKDGRSHVDRLTMEAEEKVAGAGERRPRQKKTMKKVFGVWLEFE